MTDFLIRLFVKNRDAVDLPQVRGAYGKLAGMTGIVCNVLLFAAKLAVGTLTGSVAGSASGWRKSPPMPITRSATHAMNILRG